MVVLHHISFQIVIINAPQLAWYPVNNSFYCVNDHVKNLTLLIKLLVRKLGEYIFTFSYVFKSCGKILMDEIRETKILHEAFAFPGIYGLEGKLSSPYTF